MTGNFLDEPYFFGCLPDSLVAGLLSFSAELPFEFEDLLPILERWSSTVKVPIFFLLLKF
jgi:hypothetical protein